MRLLENDALFERRICGNAFAGTGLTEVVLPAECELEPEAFDPHVVITRTGLHPTVWAY